MRYEKVNEHGLFRETESGKLYQRNTPRWLYVGQRVLCRWEGCTGVWCTVIKAAGDAGVVENEARDIRRLVLRDEMYVLDEVPAEGVCASK